MVGVPYPGRAGVVIVRLSVGEYGGGGEDGMGVSSIAYGERQQLTIAAKIIEDLP